jgi:hypothetical protein
MARRRAIVFRAARPDNEPTDDSDPSDWECDPPEAPLLRAWVRPGGDLATR